MHLRNVSRWSCAILSRVDMRRFRWAPSKRRVPGPVRTTWPCVVSGSIVLAYFALLTIGAIAQPKPSPKPEECTAIFNKGLVVEAVAEHSEGARAGLVEGDLLLGWSRGDTNGAFKSPFDLLTVETEQAPRGLVTFNGKRNTTDRTWVIGPDRWSVRVRPSLPASVLDRYRAAQETMAARQFSEADDAWNAAALQAKQAGCSLVSLWLALHAGDSFSEAKEWKRADAFYARAADMARGETSDVAVAVLRTWADFSIRHGDLVRAEKHNRLAVRQAEQAGRETLTLAERLTALGSILAEHGKLQEAEPLLVKARQIDEKLAPESLPLAAAFNGLGVVADLRGELDQADSYYQKSLQIKTNLAPDSLPVASTEQDLGILADERGDLDKATEYNVKALAIREKLDPGGRSVAISLNCLGNIAFEREDLSSAEGYYNRALEIQEKIEHNDHLVSLILSNLGVIAEQRGDLASAEKYFRQALTIVQLILPQSLDLPTILSNLGDLAENRGDNTAAESYYRQALGIRRIRIPRSLDTALTLNNLGSVLENKGDVVQSTALLHEALAIYKELKIESIYSAEALNNLGTAVFDGGKPGEAEKYFQQALDLRTKLAKNSLDEADSLSSLADVARERGDLAAEERYVNQALSIRKTICPEGRLYAQSLADLADLSRRQGKLDEADRAYAEAINVLEKQIAHFGGTTEARAGFRSKRADYFVSYSQLLVKEDQPSRAFEVLERGRTRTFLETLSQAKVDLDEGTPAPLLDRKRRLLASLREMTNHRLALSQNHTDEQIAEINRKIEAALAESQDLEGQIRVANPKYDAFTQLVPLTTSYVQQQLLDADTVLLEYALGEKSSLLFLITSSSIEAHTLPSRRDLEKAAVNVYRLLTAGNRPMKGKSEASATPRFASEKVQLAQSSAVLSRMILGPVAEKIDNKRLLVVADGALQYIPFAVLPSPRRSVGSAQPLIAQCEIVSLPSASVLAQLRRQSEGRAPNPNLVAVLADPVFSAEDPRILRAGKIAPPASTESSERLTRSLNDVGHMGIIRLERLFYSRQEAENIAAAAGTGRALLAVDFQANRELASSSQLSRYRIVHFATHGLLDNAHPELSGLVLSMVDAHGKPVNGYLDLQDIYSLDLPVDLVVLSACETALGKEVSGEGLIGLTRGFMYAGSRRVVASLWEVNDAATSELMGRFYRAMIKGGMRPAAALRQAQMGMLHSRQWSDPYNWAAFTIQGEWR
jgi:CHAT domain-containing protein/Tfp pilus assembly protein PilF